MTSNLTLITSIILTAVAATAGTYYMATQVVPNNTAETVAAQQPNPVVNATPAPTNQPATVATNQQPGKPIEVIVKTEVIQKERPHRYIDHMAEHKRAFNQAQPKLEVFH